MNIVLYRPQNIYNLYNYIPLGLIHVGTALANAGHSVTILAANQREDYWHELSFHLKNANWIGISATTSEIPHAVNIAKQIRMESRVPIVWGGWHATLFCDQMEKSNLCDAYITGPGELAVLNFTDILQHGRIEKKHFTMLPDINSLPSPNYSLFSDWKWYVGNSLTDIFSKNNPNNIRWLPYQSSIGCPHRCAFCVNVVSNNRTYLAKEPYKVIDELKGISESYAVNHFKIIDDNFFVQKKRVDEIAERLIESHLKVTWDAECRVDYFSEGYINETLLIKLKQAGLVQLTLGIESGSQRSLDAMRKDTTPAQAQRAIELCNKAKIYVRCSFILDIPGDTPEDIYETVRFINKMRRYPYFTCGVHTFRPYPGSELTESLINKELITAPKTLEGWTETLVRNHTATDVVRHWLQNYNISSPVSFYQSLESGMWIKPHQLSNPLLRKINTLFMNIAKYRNRIMFYRWTLDRSLYKVFKNYCYAKGLIK
ncbi:MAG: B12-binding domain-containing radical SAM protein [Desulfobacterales bacterium]|nr:B12-binding domain-containing radical SAM protein [Desulfobacterales bacterium]